LNNNTRQDDVDSIVKLTKIIEAEKKKPNPDREYISYLEDEIKRIR